MVRLSPLICAASFVGAAFMSVPAQATQYQADYTVSYLGLPVAKSSFQSQINGDKYSVKGTLRSAGLVRTFEKTSGTTSIQGTLNAKGAVPSAYNMAYKSGKKAKSTRIDFRGGNVVATKVVPPSRAKGKWKPLADKDLKSVVDPLSATLLRGRSPQEVCNRTIRFFDGKMRGDIKLRYAGKRPFSTKGFKGDSIHCAGRFIPVAGYDQNKKDIIWMQKNSKISMSFASIGGNDLYAPVAAELTTRVGKITVRASRFVVTN